MTSIKTRHIDFLPSRVATFDGEEHLFFSGTSYLGVGHQPEFRAALSEGIARYGTIFSASRNNNLQLTIYEETESFLAKWTGAAAALTVTSGLLAGQLAVNVLKNKKDSNGAPMVFIYAPSAHPAVWEAPPQYKFNNQKDFGNTIVATVEQEKNAPITIVSNAIDMLTCAHFDFSWTTQLPDNQDITLLIDDSHGIGVTGENGAGIFQKIRKLAPSSVKIIVIASLAKALGIPGGVILSDIPTVFSIRNNPLFVGASPIIPAYLFAFLMAQPMYDNARKTLTHNVQLFKKTLTERSINKSARGIDSAQRENNISLINNTLNPMENTANLVENTLNPMENTANLINNIPSSDFDADTEGTNFSIFKTPIINYPVLYTPVNALFDYLLAEKIFISHFAYPKPNDPPITRVVLSALHTANDVECLAIKVNDFLY